MSYPPPACGCPCTWVAVPLESSCPVLVWMSTTKFLSRGRERERVHNRIWRIIHHGRWQFRLGTAGNKVRGTLLICCTARLASSSLFLVCSTVHTTLKFVCLRNFGDGGVVASLVLALIAGSTITTFVTRAHCCVCVCTVKATWPRAAVAAAV